MTRDWLGVAALVGISAAAATCTVNFEGKRFCEPHCTGTGGAGGGNGGGFTETFQTSGGPGGASGGGAGQGGAGGCGGKAVAPSDDPFTGKDVPPNAFWTLLFQDRSNPAMKQEVVKQESGLLITPTPMATWYTGANACPSDGCGAPAVVQRVSGNFAMKTHVSITFTAGGHPDPFAAAGILLAEPCDPAKNNVVWDIGYQEQAAMGTDFYQTIDGSPTLPQLEDTMVVAADLYACRLEDQFYFYVDTTGNVPMADSPDASVTWTVGDLDVGLTAHVNGPKQVIQALFHSVSFATPMNQGDCVNAL